MLAFEKKIYNKTTIVTTRNMRTMRTPTSANDKCT